MILIKVCYFVNLEGGSILSFDESSLAKSIKPFSSSLSLFPVFPVVPLFYTFVLRELCQGMVWPLVSACNFVKENK